MCNLLIRNLGIEDYEITLKKMRLFTQERTAATIDEFWCLQHPAVFTLGANADKSHVLSKSKIPIVQSDRGGQVTYHGPGQIILYLLIDLRRKNLGVKKLVQNIEQAIVDLLVDYQIKSEARADAHGVYVEDAKIASLGLRVSSGCSYHGLALNVDMDLNPFLQINPCGFAGMKVTQLKDFGVRVSCEEIHEQLSHKLSELLNFNFYEKIALGA